MWLEKEKPGFLTYYGEKSPKVMAEYNSFLRAHVHTTINIVSYQATIEPDDEFGPWQCECGSLKVREHFANQDRIISVDYDTNQPYSNVHFDNLSDGYQSIGFNCICCNKPLSRQDEIKIIHNMRE
jgi:hypothetical protein